MSKYYRWLEKKATNKLLVEDTLDTREQVANDMVERLSMEDLIENYKYYLNKDWDDDPSMFQQDYSNYSNTEQGW